MKKDGELKVGASRCDCGRRAVVIVETPSGAVALCERCKAKYDKNIKSAAVKPV